MKKKIFFCFLTVSSIIAIIAIIFNINKKDNKQNILKNEKEFQISKIQFYSGANGISNTTSYQNPEWNLKVYQYTDIAIYLNRLNNEISEKNYISDLKISNIQLNFPDKEEVYYINPNLFGNNSLDIDKKIEGSLEYNVINDENIENKQNYNIPVFFQDCSNPITIRFVNYLKDNYKVPSDRTLEYNGNLITEIGLDIEDLDKNLSFDLEITTRDGEKKIQKVDIEIPFENKENSILDGDYKSKLETNIEF